jgi:hypothetical protein
VSASIRDRIRGIITTAGQAPDTAADLILAAVAEHIATDRTDMRLSLALAEAAPDRWPHGDDTVLAMSVRAVRAELAASLRAAGQVSA